MCKECWKLNWMPLIEDLRDMAKFLIPILAIIGYAVYAIIKSI